MSDRKQTKATKELRAFADGLAKVLPAHKVVLLLMNEASRRLCEDSEPPPRIVLRNLEPVLNKEIETSVENTKAQAAAAVSIHDRRPRVTEADMVHRVHQILCEQLGLRPLEIKNESSLVNSLGADSMDLVEILMAIEDKFGIEINDEQAERCTRVEQILDLLRTLMVVTP